jgi:hypothetical protein
MMAANLVSKDSLAEIEVEKETGHTRGPACVGCVLGVQINLEKVGLWCLCFIIGDDDILVC